MTRRAFSLIPLCLLSLLLVFSIGCKKGDPILTPVEQSVDNNRLTLDKMKSCIKEAGLRRGWAIKDMDVTEAAAPAPAKGKGAKARPAAPSRTKGQAQATLNIRTHTVIVDIFYTATTFTIAYRDSINMDYDAAAGTIHSQYNSWIKNLAEEIRIRAISI